MTGECMICIVRYLHTAIVQPASTPKLHLCAKAGTDRVSDMLATRAPLRMCIGQDVRSHNTRRRGNARLSGCVDCQDVSRPKGTFARRNDLGVVSSKQKIQLPGDTFQDMVSQRGNQTQCSRATRFICGYPNHCSGCHRRRRNTSRTGTRGSFISSKTSEA